jgi:hypothetical protein
MHLLITTLLSLTALLADNPQAPSAQPKQAARIGDHNQGRGVRNIGSTARPNPSVAHSAAKGSLPKPVHVRQYTRKDGTVVRAHNRAAPGIARKSNGSRRYDHQSCKCYES